MNAARKISKLGLTLMAVSVALVACATTPAPVNHSPGQVPSATGSGFEDRIAQSKEYVFDKAPYHPKSKYITVSADHLQVPSAATKEVISWIKSLEK